ncbi:MAG: hypothetical protein HQ478_09885 [Chloroflexi bacterium]|nr:hypothetical protein [Chloroflexota bacterium]
MTAIDFTRDDDLRRLHSYFQKPPGLAYHYTSKQAAQNIDSGQLRLTRADYLADREEIEHGLSILSDTLGPDSPYMTLPDAIRERLSNCYVLSLSEDSDNAHLTNEYANPPGGILEFEYPMFHAHGFWHSVPEEDGSYRLHYFQDLYDQFDGFVIYDDDLKLEIIEFIVQLLPRMLDPATSAIERFGFVVHDLIVPFLLFKNSKFMDEAEYRIAFVRKAEGDNKYESCGLVRGNPIRHIAVRMPSSVASIVARTGDWT